MAGDYLLDTNIVTAILNREPALLARTIAGKILVPSIVIGELYYGAENSARRDENRVRVDQYARSIVILNCDAVTGKHYGRIKAQLRAKGKMIPDNDIWIAALAIQSDLTVVTRDGHFQYVDGLRVEAW
jgi:tRNA(fMet)-specific endonuclease VapC